jgi:hypothetical protein
MGLPAHVPAFELAGMGKAAMSFLLVALLVSLPGEGPMVTIMVEISLNHSGVLAVPISVIVPVSLSEGPVAIRMVARSLSTVVTIVAMEPLVRPPLVPRPMVAPIMVTARPLIVGAVVFGAAVRAAIAIGSMGVARKLDPCHGAVMKGLT